MIKGPLGKPFEGGFEILRSGHLVYMDRVAQLDTVEGFTGGSKLMIDLQLWKFLQYAAKLCGDKNADEGFGEPTARLFGDNGDGNGGGDNGGGNGGGDT